MALVDSMLSRARGCLLGQLAGDALGSLVEFESAGSIARRFPSGVRVLVDGGAWNTLAGQPTDDSELALALARSIVASGGYSQEAAARAYAAWCGSGPFDIGATTRTALEAASRAAAAGDPAASAALRAANRTSQANGALMRISPLGIAGASMDPAVLAGYARQDCLLTHPHPACQSANVVFVHAIAFAIRTGAAPEAIYREAVARAAEPDIEDSVKRALAAAAEGAPSDFMSSQGWVLIAFRNAFHQLLRAANLEEGVVDTVSRGGDTDTNAAIAGALLGAAWGGEAVPVAWRDAILNCRPEKGNSRVRRPRPPEYWPVDALELAARLLGRDAAVL